MKNTERRAKLIALRCEKGLTQTEMAKLCNVCLSTYMKIELCQADGKMKFWETLKDKFELNGEQLCEVQKRVTIQEY